MRLPRQGLKRKQIIETYTVVRTTGYAILSFQAQGVNRHAEAAQSLALATKFPHSHVVHEQMTSRR
jgi:hypothetical protein